jgi:hypothetical protein
MHPQPLGSMSNDSRKMVVNWLVRLLESAPGLDMARVGVMSIGYGLSEIVVGFHNQNHWLPASRRH